MKRRIECRTSRTAEWTCVARAVSSLETNSLYRCDDYIARQLLPRFFQLVLHIPLFRMLYKRIFLEGLLRYLQPESVEVTFRTIQDYGAKNSWVAFDYVHASVLRNENLYYGEAHVAASIARAGEQWHFGIEKEEVENFLSSFGLKLLDHKDAHEMERTYFMDSSGSIAGRVNGVHCLATAENVRRDWFAVDGRGRDGRQSVCSWGDPRPYRCREQCSDRPSLPLNCERECSTDNFPL
jgi:O-methyltransferase involved in polyketide biosynthesis